MSDNHNRRNELPIAPATKSKATIKDIAAHRIAVLIERALRATEQNSYLQERYGLSDDELMQVLAEMKSWQPKIDPYGEWGQSAEQDGKPRGRGKAAKKHAQEAS